MKQSFATTTRLKTGEVVPSSASTDFIRASTGEVHVATPTGVSKMVTESNINTVLASAGGAGWAKVQVSTANYNITRPTSGAGLDLHIEVGGTLAALTVANWPIPASGVDQLRIRNMSAVAQSFTATGFSGVVTADGNAATSGSYSIPVDMAVHITIDEDGWIQVAPMGQEVSQAEFDTALALKAPITSLTDGSIYAEFESVREQGVTFFATASDIDSLATGGWHNVQNPVGGSLAAGWWYIYNGLHRNGATGVPNTTYKFQLAKRLDLAGAVGNNLLMRVQTSGAWSAWATLAVTTDIPALSSTAPVMDGTAAVGTGTTSARADHVHASDTSRAAATSLTDGSTNAYFDRLRWDGATVISSTDLNSLTVSGFYDGTTLTNAPNNAAGWFYIIHQRHSNLADATWHHQTAYALGSGAGSVAGEVYVRNSVSGTWSAWTRIDNAALPALSSTTPAMNGTAAVGTGTTSARADHVHASDTSRAPLDSPVLTGTPQVSGNPKLGSNSGHAQRSFSDITGAAMLMVPVTGTASSTIATTDVAARYVKPGTASTKANAVFDVVVGSYTAGINGATQVDFRLANAGTNVPDMTVMSLKGDGSVSMSGRFSSAFNGAKVTRAADGAVATGATISIAWDTETYDTNSYHDNATNPSRLVAPVAGYYRIGATLTWASSGTGFRALGYVVNGGTDVWLSSPLPVTGDITRHNFSTELYLAAGSYVEIRAYQSSGASLNLGGTTSSASISYLGS